MISRRDDWREKVDFEAKRDCITEMPTSGDLKSGDCLFFTPPAPPRKIDPAPNGNDLGHYMMSYMMYILSKEC